jgi:F0F1-type ATP synthase delta subunit
VAPNAAEQHFAGLPLLVVGPVDIGRLIRELEAVDETLHQTELRTKAHATELPKISQLMDQTVELNKLNLLQAADRQRLLDLLTLVKAEAPLLHISFSADPNAAFMEKLVAWLRREIHPLTLLTIGLQPNLGAGCIVRTTNKSFDLSLRQDFKDKRDLLMAKLTPQEPAA